MPESAVEFLEHYGVLGMKWGKRNGGSSGSSEKPRAEVVETRQLKNGGSLTLTKNPTPSLARFIARYSPRTAENIKNAHHFSLTDSAGKTVGSAQLDRRGTDEMNVVWIDVKSKERGNGYATAAMKGIQDYSAAQGVKKITLEVPGNSPDARHIYEKIGFKSKGMYKDSTAEDDYVWGGLEAMEYTVPQNKLKQTDAVDTEVIDYIVRAIDNMPLDGNDNETSLQMSENTDTRADEFLAHYGVVGMKWGKRRGGLKSRVQGAVLDSIQRRKAGNQAIASGNGKARDFARAGTRRVGGYAALATMGSKKIAATRVSSLNASEARVKAGKPKVRDIIEALGSVSVIDLAVSRTDKRG